jgi:copper chaperone CopZ
MSTSAYIVTGMTCEHCVNAVTDEVTQIPGVRAVDVDLVTGGLTVASAEPLEEAALRAAVEEAGYELVVPSGGAA